MKRLRERILLKTEHAAACAVLAMLAIGSTPAQAQPGYLKRCGTVETQNDSLFEHWLQGKKNTFTRLASGRVYRIPVVVHVIHEGEPVGQGSNHSVERILSQVQALNEDYRRKKDTPGYNQHPDGGDARIEFVLATKAPDGQPTDGIVRVNSHEVTVTPVGNLIMLGAQYSLWNVEEYLNIWSIGLGIPIPSLLGLARLPVTDLPGIDETGYPDDIDGVFVEARAFGKDHDNNFPDYNMGRSLTHEIGHFLGLIHTWGSANNNGQCFVKDDFCSDTPPVLGHTAGCPSVNPVACDGRPAMMENYMDWSDDRCMNIFTNEQIARMHTVLENSPRRKSLLTSPALPDPVMDIPHDAFAMSVEVYPNPASNKVHIALGDQHAYSGVQITGYTLLGRTLFYERFSNPVNEVVLDLPATADTMLLLKIEGNGMTFTRLLALQHVADNQE